MPTHLPKTHFFHGTQSGYEQRQRSTLGRHTNYSLLLFSSLSIALFVVQAQLLHSACASNVQGRRCDVLQGRGQDGLVVVVLLLLLTDDLQLQEELLLLEEPGVGRVHGLLAGLLLLVRGNVLVVLELLDARLGLLALLAAALVPWHLGLALLW